MALHVEYAERGSEYGILFIFNLFCEYVPLAFVRIISYTGLARRNTVFIFVWLHHGLTLVASQAG